MLQRLLLLTLLAAPGFAQRFELAGTFGAGTFALSSGEPAVTVSSGVQLCAFCSGHLGLFGEYTHWFGFSGSNIFYFDRTKNADLAGLGLRIQGGAHVRPFFDVGVVAGRDVHRFSSAGAIGGVVIGGGLAIPLDSHWFVRPQIRAYGLSPHTTFGLNPHWALGGLIAVGYSF